MRINKIVLIFSVFVVLACDKESEKDKENSFPVFGRPELVTKVVDGKEVTDTIPHQIPDFKLMDQDSNWVTPESFAGKVYVADFFFTSCPTICPQMKKEMLRVYEAYQGNDQVGIISHTIDPVYDTIPLLKDFAERLGVSAPKWHFVTGDKEEIYKLGQTGYMVTAMEDENEAGGYIHSGAFLLVDKDKHIRGVYDGTQSEDVDKLINDIALLLKTYDQ
jgi:protein SCO1/2